MIRSISFTLMAGLCAAVLVLTMAPLGGFTAAAGEEYKSKAKKAKLLSGELRAFQGMEANMIRFQFPPSYVGGRHYHTGDVFVYVEQGSFVVETDEGTQTFEAGTVYHETPNVSMVARNGSSEEGAVIVVFQVGKSGEPIMTKSE